MTRGLGVAGLLLFAVAAAAQPFTVSTLAGGSPPPLTNPAAISLQLSRVASDAAGDLYFPSGAMLLKLDTGGALTRLAGNTRPGCTGDGASSTNAQVEAPTGIAVDLHGNIYFADPGCQSVRKIDTNGEITTIAGTGVAGYTGDNGPATQAKLNYPEGLAVDAGGNLFIADSRNYCVREVLASNGNILTYAGTGTQSNAKDNVPATQSPLQEPIDLAVDPAGNLYIADDLDSRIRMVNPQGTITTFAGNGNFGPTANGVPATSTTLDYPTGVAWDAHSQSLYILQRAKPIEVVSAGTIRLFAGASDSANAPLQNGQSAANAYIAGTGIAVDPSGNLIVATSRLWRISPSLISTALAGNGAVAYSGDGASPLTAQFLPNSVAVDSSGSVYVADVADGVIRKIASSGTISTFAGTGTPGTGGDGAPAVRAQIAPNGITIDKNGNLFIADLRRVVRKITPDGIIHTVAGNGTLGILGDGGPAVDAQLVDPVATAVDASGNLYIADAGTCTIREVTTDGIIHTIAGKLSPVQTQIADACFSVQTGDGIPATSAVLNTPVAVAVDAHNNVWFAEQANDHTPTPGMTRFIGYDYIRKITPDGIIHIVAGQGSSAGDGIPAASAVLPLDFTTGIVADASGNVFFTDEWRARKIDSQGILTTVAGQLSAGYSGDGGPALSAKFQSLAGIAVDSAGNFYLADQGALAIRVLKPAAPPPPVGPVVSAVTNAASNLAGALAPGEIVTIYGSGLGPAVSAPVTSAPNSAGSYPSVLSGTSVLFNGQPGAMIYTSAAQAAAVVPYGVGGGSVQVSVEYQGAIGQTVTVPLAAANPALFTFGSGTGQAAAVNQDGSLNGPAAPIAAGGVIILFATGEGATNPPGLDGALTGVPPPLPILPVTVTIGGQQVVPAYAGEAPQEIAGLMQLNVIVPSTVTPGAAVPVSVQVGGATSPAGVTIAVGQN
jgi:uncharacterized protein (TIGR03437 family)